MSGIIGKKLGMTQIFGDGGKVIPVTVIEAEPGTVILDRVAHGSPAQQSGLRVGDRIYAVAGRPFTSEREIRERLLEAGGNVKVFVERLGHIRTVELRPAASTDPVPTTSSRSRN